MDRIESSFVAPKEELVQESNKELLQRVSTTFFFLHEGVITTDAAGKILLMNKSAENLTGWSSEEAYDKEFAEVFHWLIVK